MPQYIFGADVGCETQTPMAAVETPFGFSDLR